MGFVVRFSGPRQVDVREYAEPPLDAHYVRLRTLYSGISAGTELTAYRGSNPYLNKRWDEATRLFVDGAVTVEYPIEGWGYEEVGEVAEAGDAVTAVAVGDVVWGAWGHRSTAVLHEDQAAPRLLDTGVDPMLGIFSQIGAIALNTVLDADIHVGEHVAVFGQGAPGLLVTQLARLNGAKVIAVDPLARRLELARALGASHTLLSGHVQVGEEIKRLTEGRGADVSIEISGNYQALHEAIRATAYSARVVSAGFFQRDGAGLFLGEEFHHNRIQVVCSQISGVAPQHANRWDGMRLRRVFMGLAAEGRLELEPLVTHTFAAQDAAEAFRLLDQHPEQAVQVVLKF
jgi:2-desacetyl-2-hydroxyethyl bacteriochlorophyllide A dehydrogenase